ncbi:MAG: uncharacterized protein QG597_4776 [Actinomycetota bacterium]|nr:uncharacterized protein [Actinomycetota bacterium]
MSNRLRDALSPYLRQHADNPVDWWPWGQAAFDEARRRDVPVFLSVGYAACHWCHVMAHESFEHPALAALLNEHFVSIKVDREEHPDVDATYMAATTALTGRGGWPMSVWLDHDGRAFHAGTYFPPTPRLGMPSFPQVLDAIWQAWRDRREQVGTSAAQIAEALARQREAARAADVAGDDVDLAEVCDEAVRRLAADFDPARGGFGGAPKFPPSMVLEFLLRHHARTGDPVALDLALTTLRAMARGGIYDQLGGGFARYSVDADWVVPHFEKMLYDNALLLRVYAHWWRATGDPLARRVVVETAEFLLRDLRTPEGGFASALDADSVPPRDWDDAQGVGGRSGSSRHEGAHGQAVEGAYYVWSRAELIAVLGPADGSWAADLCNVTERGTFEQGRSTLQLRVDPDDQGRWADVRHRLLSARTQRPAPARDDKVVAAWNGLAIAALAEAGALFDEPQWVAAAEAAADVVLAVHLTADGGLRRVSREGVAGSARGVLEDYADVAEGLLTLYQATGDARWFVRGQGLLGTMIERFGADGGSAPAADAAHGSACELLDSEPDSLLAQGSDPSDNAYPSGSSAAAAALLTLAALGGSAVVAAAAGVSVAEAPTQVAATALRAAQRTRSAALTLVLQRTELMRRHPRFAGVWLATTQALLAGPAEVAVVGAADDPLRAELIGVARASTSPGMVLAVGEPGEVTPPLLADRVAAAGRTVAYVCEQAVCRVPTADPATMAEQLVSIRGSGH